MGRIDWEKDKKRRLVHERGFEPLAATARWNEPPPDFDREASFAGALGVGNKKARGRAAMKKAEHNALPGAKLKELKLQFLHLVARSELRGQPIPGISKKLRQDLKLEIVIAGGVLEWARRQPDYAKIRKQQAKKLDAKAEASPSETASHHLNDDSESDVLSSIERLAKAQRNLHQLLAHARSELQRVDQEIDRLRRLGGSDENGEER